MCSCECSVGKWMGIDIGGTTIKAGLISRSGDISGRASTPTNSSMGIEAIETAVARVALLLGGAGSCKGVGIGLPGTVNPATGIVVSSPNIPCWHAYEASRRLGASLEAPVSIENDANCAALGEGWIGAARDVPSFIAVTLGTGVGGGIVLEGKLWRGQSARAGEIGHVTVDPSGAACGCGSHGCLETVASATGITRLAGEMGLAGTVEDLARAARLGADGPACLFERAGAALGIALSGWINLMDVHTVVIAGGLSGALDLMRPRMVREIGSRCYDLDLATLRIIPALLGEDAGVVGAARASMTA